MRLVEALVNLIGNCAKYAADGLRPRIDIGFRRGEDGEAAFFVRDNDPGIEPDEQEKVFGLFRQVDRNGNGTGAGLAIVKRIIEVHGGRIWIESAPGRGCAVCFTLPLAGGRISGKKDAPNLPKPRRRRSGWLRRRRRSG
ncbi:sensor histidine kinase [Methanocrinis sp.]|uniref:sensor histidine kinase n=1 Tax=Methanocrinis sp. TaxID=3101522 RepID=UPI003D0FBB1D